MGVRSLTELTAEVAARLRAAPGFIFDMDGTIALGDKASGGHAALPGAIEMLALLRRRGTPFRVFTNGTASPPAIYAASLRKAGFDVADGEMMTPSTSAADYFSRRRINKVRVLGLGGVQEPLLEAGITVVGPSEKATGVEAVYTGWFREFTFPDLEAACHDVWAGAGLYTASHVPFFATKDGRGIGASFAINTMITSLTQKRATVLGKPSRHAMRTAARHMGIPQKRIGEMVVFGDDPLLESRMANACGALSVGMTTGLLDAAGFAARPERERPRLVLDDYRPVLAALRD